MQLSQIHSYGKMIGKSEKIGHVFKLIEKVARSNSNILLTGESGTGKEIAASTIHEKSARATMPFVAINCSAIPEHLLESELFGHKRGSFTGAQEARKGLFEAACGGTIFLDEIGDMPLDLQSKLLRVIQEREVKPVGENKAKPIDVRIISATHRNLEQMIVEGTFREDLYYRLAVVPIHLPPLRERKEDIPLLVSFFLNKFCSVNNSEKKYFEESAMEKLCRARWSGNIRELENTIERAVVLSDAPLMGELDVEVDQHLGTEQRAPSVFSQLITLDELERNYIRYVLAETDFSKEKTAKVLGINRKTLYRKEVELGFKSGSSDKKQLDAVVGSVLNFV